MLGGVPMGFSEGRRCIGKDTTPFLSGLFLVNPPYFVVASPAVEKEIWHRQAAGSPCLERARGGVRVHETGWECGAAPLQFCAQRMTKKFLFALLYTTGLLRIVAWLNRKQVTVLCYHSITKRQDSRSNDPHRLHLAHEYFRDHLDYLQAHYNLISLDEWTRARSNNQTLPANSAILTFDDGTRNFFTVAAPMLKERRIPATAFIITGDGFTEDKLTARSEWRAEDDDSYLSWNEIKQLAADGFEFGSHTATHAALTEISLAEARSELNDSLETIRANIPQAHIPLAYPHGRTSEDIARLAESAGYSCALTTELGMNNAERSLFKLRRTVISADDTLPSFVARLSGFTRWYERVMSFFKERQPLQADQKPICDPLVGGIPGKV
jgi:peptidoglycan/xylan/chitin deacetylase (PgdA/CDA1 family)